MSFVFGWYSFKIKSFSATDLQLDAELWSSSTFEVRQKVFHLFWIPFFSLGKMYAVRKQGKLYEVSASVEKILKEKQKYRTPWYSFFIPIALITIFIGGGIFINVAEYFMRRKSYNSDKEQYEIAINYVSKNLSSMEINSYLRLVNHNRQYDDKVYLLKLVNDDNLNKKFIVYEVAIPKLENSKYEIKKADFDTLSFTISDLQKAVCIDYDAFSKNKTCGLKILTGEELYTIDAILKFDQPIIDGAINWDFWHTIRTDHFHYRDQFAGFKNDKSWKITLEFQNFGSNADLVAIKNREGNLIWNDTLPMKVPTYEYLKNVSITASTVVDPTELTFKSVFVFKDSLNRNYEYLIEGKNNFFTIKRK